ncbi:MAG TPA: ATP-binding cassette domain-containing protein [Bryobacteraceae bacterium]|nr:ATP-binding cassette domain-containing protein [Bryobacteraceae bacterium]
MQFGELVAVNQASFEIPSGRICAMLGPNGAGKSTLMKMLTGLLAPLSGEAFVAGLDVHRMPLEVRRVVGILPESLGLFDMLTVEEHLRLCAAGCGCYLSGIQIDRSLILLRVFSRAFQCVRSNSYCCFAARPRHSMRSCRPSTCMAW